MANRAYTADALSLGDYTLEGAEAHHLATVLRAQPGQAITLFNGDGADWHAEIAAVAKKRLELRIVERIAVHREREHPLTIAAAMPKGDRGDFMIEKLTELGVTNFVPLITERTVVVPKESRIENLRRAVIEASKQCGRNVLMHVSEPMKWSTFAASELPATRILLHPGGGTMPAVTEAVIAIGPEGGFTDEEARIEGWNVASLGPRILRIETAAIAAVC